MASNAMADFGRMPTSRKVILLVLILGVLGFFYHRLVYKSLASEVDKAAAAHKANVARNDQLEKDVASYETLKKRKGKFQENIKKLQMALPTEADLPTFFEGLERRASESGVSVLGWTRRPEEPVEQFIKVALDVEITGTFMQIKRFFASLVDSPKGKPTPGQPEERERIVTIENLVLTQPTVRNREIILTARFAAVTFRQEDAKPAAPAAPGVTPAGSPNPSGATGSATPLPGADTPRGAKLRVEDSLKKDEQRRDDNLKDPGVRTGSGSARLKGGL